MCNYIIKKDDKKFHVSKFKLCIKEVFYIYIPLQAIYNSAIAGPSLTCKHYLVF